MATCPTIGNANVQEVFICLEDVSGIQQPPTVDKLIVPAGDASLSQTPTFTNSDEKSASLDVIAQFQNKVGAGEGSVPMLVHIDSTGKIQGHDALVCLMGNYNTSSKEYTFNKCRPTATIYARFDTLVKFGIGAVITGGILPLSTEAGQHFDLSAQFREMGWAGRSFVSAYASGVVTVLDSKGVDSVGAYTVGAYVQNTTKGDTNTNAGYKVSAIDEVNGTITITPTPAVDWDIDDQIDAWLPTASPIGEAIESRDTVITIDGLLGKLSSGTLTIGTPTEFADEIGDRYVGENADTERAITFDMESYFRADDAKELAKGYKGYELPVTVTVGVTTGQKMAFIMPRVKFNTPDFGSSGATMTMSRSGAVMGVLGEDSLKIKIV